METERVVADRYEYTVYQWGAITFVPHYRNPSAYVGPGYPELAPKLWTDRELLAVGAKQKKMHLWARPRFSYEDKAA